MDWILALKGNIVIAGEMRYTKNPYMGHRHSRDVSNSGVRYTLYVTSARHPVNMPTLHADSTY